MTLLKQNIDGYHAHLIQDLAKAKIGPKLESTVSLWSGDQHITMSVCCMEKLSLVYQMM